MKHVFSLVIFMLIVPILLFAAVTNTRLQQNTQSQQTQTNDVKPNPFANDISYRSKKNQFKTVKVIGAVASPKSFKLERPASIRELVELAGGIIKGASGRLEVIHPKANASACCGAVSNAASTQTSKSEEVAKTYSYDLRTILNGQQDSDAIINSDDEVILSIPFANPIYVMGCIANPQLLTPDKPITLSQALTMTGGVSRSAEPEKVQIRRQAQNHTVNDAESSNSKNEEVINVSLRDMNNKTGEFLLKPNDIITVPSSSGLKDNCGRKSILTSLDDLPVEIVR